MPAEWAPQSSRANVCQLLQDRDAGDAAKLLREVAERAILSFEVHRTRRSSCKIRSVDDGEQGLLRQTSGRLLRFPCVSRAQSLRLLLAELSRRRALTRAARVGLFQPCFRGRGVFTEYQALGDMCGSADESQRGRSRTSRMSCSLASRDAGGSAELDYMGHATTYALPVERGMYAPAPPAEGSD
jgi:hypothetical protein